MWHFVPAGRCARELPGGRANEPNSVPGDSDVSAFPSASLAVARTSKPLPAATPSCGGVPEITGGALRGRRYDDVNAATTPRMAVADTEITMFANVFTLATSGVRPTYTFAALKLAQPGG